MKHEVARQAWEVDCEHRFNKEFFEKMADLGLLVLTSLFVNLPIKIRRSVKRGVLDHGLWSRIKSKMLQ